MQKLEGKLKNIPKKPGVYQFLSKDGAVLYVGKAKNLKSRVSQYFGKADDRPQLPYLMAEAVDFNYTVVSNELESAFLENTVIKQYSPKYNIDLKDDKNYAFITIDYSTEIPQIGYSRKIQEPSTKNQRSFKFQIPNSKTRYFGPYSSAHKIKNTLNLIRKIFPFCAAHKVSQRPCFYYYMHRCPGVCIGKISLDEYQRQLDKITKFIQGNTSGIISEIKTEMAAAAKNKKFETAARLRDQLRSLEILEEKQNMIMPKRVDWDLVSLASSDGYTCVNLFKVRAGKLFDKENFVYETNTDPLIDSGSTDVYGPKALQRFLEQYYQETSNAPKNIYTQLIAENSRLIEDIITSRFNHKAGISVPQRGKILKIIKLGQLNAQEYLSKWLNDKAGNLDKINKALEQLKEVLGLPQIPKRIECYDISNTQGTNPVGSMAVFVNGLPAKSEYRKFKIQGKKSPDDFAMMREMLERRLSRLQFSPPGTGGVAPWPLPDLLVIDGGKGQLGVAKSIISAKGGSASGRQNSKFIIPVIGLAKRIEKIFLPNDPRPIILSHDQPALQLLQRLRDEAHRFGLAFHRKLRSKQAIKSALDDIPGIGPKTKKLLKQKFGTVANIKNKGLEELSNVVGKKLAQTVKSLL